MTSILKVLLYLALIMAVVAVATLNSDQRVTVTYWPGAALRDVPVFLVVIGSVFVGVLIAGIIGAAEQLRQRLRIRELRRQLDALEAEVRELRNLPITGGLMEQGRGGAAGKPAG